MLLSKAHGPLPEVQGLHPEVQVTLSEAQVPLPETQVIFLRYKSFFVAKHNSLIFLSQNFNLRISKAHFVQKFRFRGTFASSDTLAVTVTNRTKLNYHAGVDYITLSHSALSHSALIHTALYKMMGMLS